MKTPLLIEIDCNLQTCSTCDYLEYDTHKCGLFYEWLDYIGRHHFRHEECHEAERNRAKKYGEEYKKDQKKTSRINHKKK